MTGRALYVDDTAQRRPMLDLWPVCAPHARARIIRRDATKARFAPGIAAVLLAEDIPGENNTGPVRHDEPLLAVNKILFHGQMVAMVVGESAAACAPRRRWWRGNISSTRGDRTAGGDC